MERKGRNEGKRKIYKDGAKVVDERTTSYTIRGVLEYLREEELNVERNSTLEQIETLLSWSFPWRRYKEGNLE